MDKSILLELGFSEREIVVYTALLHLGNTTTGPLIRRSKISNSKIYEVLEKLIEKGLVSYVYKGKIKYFQASNPEILMDFMEDKKKKLNEEVSKLKSLHLKKEPEYEARTYEEIKAIKGIFY